MLEWKDVRSSPPLRAPKSRLAVEQPSAGGTYQKRYPTSKDEEEATAKVSKRKQEKKEKSENLKKNRELERKMRETKDKEDLLYVHSTPLKGRRRNWQHDLLLGRKIKSWGSVDG